MNIKLILLVCIVFHRLLIKEGFGIKRRIKQGARKFARLIPVERKILIPVKSKVSSLTGTISKPPPSQPPQGKKSVWIHPAVIAGGIAGSTVGLGSGMVYDSLKSGRTHQQFTVYNPLTGKRNYYRLGRSQSIPEDDRIFIKYDGPPTYDPKRGAYYYDIEREDFE